MLQLFQHYSGITVKIQKTDIFIVFLTFDRDPEIIM